MKAKTCLSRLYVFCGIIILLSGSAFADEARKQLIIDSFDSYRQAINTKDGELASGLIAYKTLAFYEDARRLALEGDREKLYSLSFPVRMYALLLRGTQDYEFLQNSNGKSVLSQLISQGAISAGGLDKADLQSIKHNEKHAEITFSVDGSLYPRPLVFVFEDGVWRFHLLGFSGPSLKMLEMSWLNAGKDINLALLKMTEHAAGRSVPETIWDNDPAGW